ncbi:MAG: LamG-like jellyroll fold domain-containing protein [Candidatus Binatia bacterium]
MGSSVWLYPMYPGHMLRSVDDGVTWGDVTSGVMPYGAISGDTDGAGTVVYIAQQNPSNKMEWSVDSGATWHNSTAPASLGSNGASGAALWDGTQFVALGVDAGGSTFYVDTAPTGFTGVAGPTWTSLGTTSTIWGGNGACRHALAYDPRVGYIACCTGANVGGYIQPGFVIASTPAGLLTATVITPTNLQDATFGASAEGAWAYNGIFFIASSRGLVAASTDGGATWTTITMPWDVTLNTPDRLGGLAYDPVHNAYIAAGMQGSLLTAPGPPPPPCDPNYYFDSLLLHMDGAVGSNTFVDSSANGFSPTLDGAPVISANSIFGSGSMNLTTSGGDVGLIYPIAAGGPLDLSTGDFTVEGWACIGVAPTYSSALAGSFTPSAGLGGWYINQAVGGYQLTSGVTIGGTQYLVYGPTGVFPSGGAWIHFALTRHGNVWNMFLNGVSGGATTQPAGSLTADTRVGIGTNPNGVINHFPGWIDEVRITKGLALYTANFTPPTQPFGGACTPLVQGIQPKYVPATFGKAIMLANARNINPRVYLPQDDSDARVPLPRLPL